MKRLQRAGAAVVLTAGRSLRQSAAPMAAGRAFLRSTAVLTQLTVGWDLQHSAAVMAAGWTLLHTAGLPDVEAPQSHCCVMHS